MLKHSIISVFICMMIFQGCAIAPKKDDVHYVPGEVRLFKKEIRKEMFGHEMKDGEKPLLGLAFSGGGVRSASFSIGALAGLHRSGILRHVDVISTVSGGGYAGYWFMSSLYATEKRNDRSFNRDELFDDCFHHEMEFYDMFQGRFNDMINPPLCGDKPDDEESYRNNKYRHQFHLANHTEPFYYSRGLLLHSLELTGKIITHTPSIITHHVANTLFDWGYNGSVLRWYYQNGLERVYGLVPEDIEPSSHSSRKYYNAESVFGLRNATTSGLSFKELKAYTEDRWKECSKDDRDDNMCNRPPLWIINSTAGVANRVYEWIVEKQPLRRTVFSMTPFGYGSGEYGIVNEPLEQLSVPRAVSISGAALDPQSKVRNGKGSGGMAALMHLVNLNLGYSIDNYNPSRSKISFHKILPWPLYYLHGFNRNKDSVDIYLSDGGHSENLGAYALIIRGIPNVIVIDAEYDSNGDFSALMDLKMALRDDRLELSFFAVKGDQSDEDFAQMLRGNREKYDPHNTEQSVFHFKVKGFLDGYISDNSEQNQVDIIYVKSSINPVLMDAKNCNKSDSVYPCTVAAYYLQKNLNGNDKHRKYGNLFPHHRTGAGEIWSSPKMYYAYRDLAAYITQNSIEWKEGKLSVTVEKGSKTVD